MVREGGAAGRGGWGLVVGEGGGGWGGVGAGVGVGSRRGEWGVIWVDSGEYEEGGRGGRGCGGGV